MRGMLVQCVKVCDPMITVYSQCWGWSQGPVSSEEGQPFGLQLLGSPQGSQVEAPPSGPQTDLDREASNIGSILSAAGNDTVCLWFLIKLLLFRIDSLELQWKLDG